MSYKHRLLGVLLLILAFNCVDRLALGLLLQDIKGDLSLSDTQLGVLGGIAFALFYSVLGIPIARWSDRGNRVVIITATTGLWSLAVTLCGVAASFIQLLCIRIAVAIGEAGCVPPAHSLIADHFDRTERPRAVALYMLGGPLSMLIGYFFAGWANEQWGWRTTFMLLGAPGLALALLASFALKEPRRERPRAAALQGVPQLAMGEVLTTLWRNTTFRHLVISFSVLSFFSYGIWQWTPAFFIRSFGMQTAELGAWFALIWGVGGLLGTYLGGELASRRAARNEPLQLRAMAAMYAGFGVLSGWMYVSSDHRVAFVLMAIAAFGYSLTLGPLFASFQSLVPDRMRALSIALVYLFANLIGMGLGPIATGVLSDAFQSWAGKESLRYALLALSPGYLWSAWHLWRASRTVSRDLSSVPSADREVLSESA